MSYERERMTTSTTESPEDLVKELQEVNQKLITAGSDVDRLSEERIALMRKLAARPPEGPGWTNVQIAASLGLTRQRVSTLLLGK